jgi:hypothetical protein
LFAFYFVAVKRAINNGDIDPRLPLAEAEFVKDQRLRLGMTGI